jgi:hypothetical protein
MFFTDPFLQCGVTEPVVLDVSDCVKPLGLLAFGVSSLFMMKFSIGCGKPFSCKFFERPKKLYFD